MNRSFLLAAYVLAACHSPTRDADPVPVPSSSSPHAAPTVSPKALLNPLPSPPRPSKVGAPPPEALRTDSGLAYLRLKEGAGARSPGRNDAVRIHYAGWTADGRMFDSSFARGEPDRIDVRGVVKGWSEGLQLMHEGDTFRLWIPAHLAYGDATNPGIPSGPLTIDVTLLAIE